MRTNQNLTEAMTSVRMSPPHQEGTPRYRTPGTGTDSPLPREGTLRVFRRDKLPEAAARKGVGYIAGPLIGPDGRRKFTCSGTPEQVEAFLRVAEERFGLRGLYGDPARGFAGGYLP